MELRKLLKLKELIDKDVRILDDFSLQEAEIIKLRIDGEKGTEIAKSRGVSKQYISLVIKKAIKKLL